MTHVKDAQEEHKERGAPPCLEADGDHDACAEAKDGHEDTEDGPASLQDESKEEEDEQYSAGKLEKGAEERDG